MQKTGAQIVIECLLEQKVDTIFGFPGGSILNIYDALYHNRDKIRHIITAHEQGAAHAADGYARATGRTGVVIATSGPGATNLVTGIATAYMDSSPIVAITCNVTLALLGRDSFQEVDIAGITMPITKHNYIVKDVNAIAGVIREAFAIARSGRPGPVLVDITKDITAAVADYTPAKQFPEFPMPHVSEKAVAKALEMLGESKRPLIYAGGGIVSSGASEELICFASKLHSPVACSLLGLGGFPADDPLFTGMIGMHGTVASARAANECDLLIAIGTRFSDRVAGNRKKFAQKAKILHIDIDAAEIDKNVLSHHHIIGDAKQILSALIRGMPEYRHDEWLAQIDEWKQKHPLPSGKGGAGEVHPSYVLEQLYRLTGGDAIITTDVGQHQMWTAQYWKFQKPRTFITSGGLGTMGFGLGASIGAKVGCPDKKVVCISGDGSFHMNMGELTTAVMHDIPVVDIIMDNRVLGMVRQWQRLFYNKRFSCTTLDRKTDYVKLAEAFGATGFRIAKKSDVVPVLEKALACSGPVVVDCVISPDENVLPMIPPGASIDEIIHEICE
ncbi:MAG: biosynthetic-type acetolactate synthase large subunit [Bacillota bacterium]|nr:biosynthetic-type acetolactate synthase large subunit [Bacillota bacterium]